MMFKICFQTLKILWYFIDGFFWGSLIAVHGGILHFELFGTGVGILFTFPTISKILKLGF